MSLAYYELAHSRPIERTVDTATETLKFVALYSMDERVVYTGLLLVAPIRRNGLPRQKISCDPQKGGVWFCDVQYGFGPLTQTDDAPENTDPTDDTLLGPEYSFDVTAKQIHVTQSKMTRWSRHKGDAADGPVYSPNSPLHGRAVNVTRDRVEGADIYAGGFELSVTVQNTLSLPQIRLLRSLCACVNNAPWRGFRAGEVLYLGASGTCKPGNLWSATHKFAIGENKSDVVIRPGDPLTGGNGITIPSKFAWDYLWVTYEEIPDPSGTGYVVQAPRDAYVEQMYDYADFTLLEIGG